MTDDDGDGSLVDEESINELMELHTHPLDINTLKREDLQMLPFLSEEQVEEIVVYAELNHPVLSLGELMFVRSLSKRQREMLRLFVAEPKVTALHDVKPLPTFKQLLNNGKSEVMWRTDIPFYTKAGYRDVPAEVLVQSPNKVYRGDKFHHAARYTFSSMGHLAAGMQMEKDAGERGIDQVAGYVMLKSVGIVRNAIVGNYRLSFGKGLAVNTSARFNKMMMFDTMGRMDLGIKKHSSTAESGYFTGAAATLHWGRQELSVFASHQKDDGTYSTDSTGMVSLKTDGLHRTLLEHSKKDNLGTTSFGGNFHWEHNDVRLSATFIATHLSVPLTPKYNTPSSLYRRYNAYGQDFMVGSLAYAYRFRRFSVSGETAISHTDHQNGAATLHFLRWRLNSDNILSLVGRYYGAKYVSLYGKAFGENANVQNEAGLFLGWTGKSIGATVLEAYVDAMHFPWMKYQVSGSSNGYEGMVQATCSPGDKWTLLTRYRIKAKQKDFTLQDRQVSILEYDTHQHAKLQFSYQCTPAVALITHAAGTMICFGTQPNEKGFAVGEDVRWQSLDAHCRIQAGMTYFKTDSYNARLYRYEPSLLYAFSSAAYYYHGFRTHVLASIPMMDRSLTVIAKLGLTKYFDRDHIGSGLEQIDADHRVDLQVQLRWSI